MSRRHDILKAFYDVVIELENQTQTTGEDFVWRTHSLTPFIGVSPQMCPGFYVFDFQEDVLQESRTPTVAHCRVFIILEIRVQLSLSEEASEVLNNILERIQIAFQQNENYRLGGLVQRVMEISSKFRITSEQDRIAAVEVAFEATYIRNAKV